MRSFEDDYRFILRLQYYETGRDYIEITNRLLNIIKEFEPFSDEYSKYSWLVGHAYFYLNRKCYHKGVIENLEKYLNQQPFSENFKDTHIQAYPNERGFIKLPKTHDELEHARLTHFQKIYYLLAKTCQQDNEITKAKKYAQLGMDILPKEKFLFFYELFEIYRKANELPIFIKLCSTLTASERNDFYNMIARAQQLIDSGYIYKPRNNPIK